MVVVFMRYLSNGVPFPPTIPQIGKVSTLRLLWMLQRRHCLLVGVPLDLPGLDAVAVQPLL